MTMNISCTLFSLTYMTNVEYLANLRACAFVSLTMSLPTIFINTSLAIVMLMSKERCKPSNIFLLNLVITNCICGYVNQPFQFAQLYKLSEQQDTCHFSMILLPMSYILGLESFLAVTSITIDRYTAVFYPFAYQRRVKFRSVIITVLAIWIGCIAVTIIPAIKQDAKPLQGILFFIGSVGVGMNIYCYYKIIKLTRRVRHEINAVFNRYGQKREESNESNLALTASLILMSMCLCNFPMLLMIALEKAIKSDVFKYIKCWTWMLIQLNSFINACITMSQLSQLRRSVFRLWRSCIVCKGAAITTVVTPATVVIQIQQRTEKDQDNENITAVTQSKKVDEIENNRETSSNEE
eukprot:gene11104-12269_t